MKQSVFFVIIVCVTINLLCSCHKESEPTDYRDQWVGEYEHFDQNGKKDGSILITKVYDSDTWIWLKGMEIFMAHYIDKDGNMPPYKSISPPSSDGTQFGLEGYIDNNILVLKYWKIVNHQQKILLDVQCVKKKEK